MAEWLRRLTRNQFRSRAHVVSNLRVRLTMVLMHNKANHAVVEIFVGFFRV